MLSIYQITRANGIYFTSGGFVLFRGLLAKGIRFADFTGFYMGFRLLWPSRRFAFGCLLMVAICFALHRGKREERGRAESVCFTLFEVGGVFLGAWRTEEKK